MPAHDLPLLIDAAREAGKIATAVSGKDAARWEKPDGAGPVTEADLAVNTMLEDRLRTARPDYGWLSEESEDSDDRLNRDTVFVIDPIDGTRSFAEGGRTWAHALAIVRQGEVTAAVVYLPMRDMLYSAALGQGASLNGAPLRASDRDQLAGSDMLITRNFLQDRHWPGGVPDVTRHYRPSLAYRLTLVAQGRFDGMVTLRQSWEWDIAAGDLILREAGARSSDRTGAALRFNTPSAQLDGVVAAGRKLHRPLIDALQPVARA